VLRVAERLIVASSLVPTTPFLDPRLFEWTAMLEVSWREIRAELDGLLNRHDYLPNFQDIVPHQELLTDDNRWKAFFFVGLGHRADGNCKLCPRTAALLDEIPGLVTAFFSILSPGKRIDPHRGPYRGLLRYHLALRVAEPQDAAGIRVGGEVSHWKEGASLLFDDGYEHSAWNETDGFRAVLFLDVVRPLRWPASRLNSALLRLMSDSPYARTAKRRQDQWAERFRQLGGPGQTSGS